MTPSLRWMLTLLVAWLGACVPPYRPPSANEPHAIVKFRRSYERVAGASLREAIDVDEHRAYADTSPSGAASAPRIDAVLVHPVPATTRVAAEFFHVESRMVRERYTVQVPHYETESYDCSTGYGANRNHRRCTRSVTRYRSETKYRLVTRPVEISDGACTSSVAFAPVVGHVYLAEYTYRDHHACQLSCFEQLPARNGQFRTQLCPMPPPSE